MREFFFSETQFVFSADMHRANIKWPAATSRKMLVVSTDGSRVSENTTS